MATSTEFDVFEAIDVDFDALYIDTVPAKYPGMYRGALGNLEPPSCP